MLPRNEQSIWHIALGNICHMNEWIHIEQKKKDKVAAPDKACSSQQEGKNL